MLNTVTEFLKSGSLLAKIIKYVGNIAIIIVIGTLTIKLLTKYVKRYLDKIDTQHSKTIGTVLISFISYLIYFFMGVAILRVSNVDVTSILAVASIGSVAIGFGAQALVRDVISGAFILLEEQYQVEDMVTIGSCTGRVEEIGLRTTRLRNVENNEVYIIPNGEIKIVTNKTKDFQKVFITLKIEYVSDLETLRERVEAGVEGLNGDKRLLSNIIVTAHANSIEPVIDIKLSCFVVNNEMISVNNDLSDALTKTLHQHGYVQFFKTPLAYVK